MNVLITYDLVENAFQESKHAQIKNSMKESGYLDNFTVSGDDSKTKYYLPNTSLWKKDCSPSQAAADLKAAVKKHNATLERMLANEFTSTWEAISGKAYR